MKRSQTTTSSRWRRTSSVTRFMLGISLTKSWPELQSAFTACGWFLVMAS